jgi:hypothetical protein
MCVAIREMLSVLLTRDLNSVVAISQWQSPNSILQHIVRPGARILDFDPIIIPLFPGLAAYISRNLSTTDIFALHAQDERSESKNPGRPRPQHNIHVRSIASLTMPYHHADRSVLRRWALIILSNVIVMLTR